MNMHIYTEEDVKNYLDDLEFKFREFKEAAVILKNALEDQEITDAVDDLDSFIIDELEDSDMFKYMNWIKRDIDKFYNPDEEELDESVDADKDNIDMNKLKNYWAYQEVEKNEDIKITKTDLGANVKIYFKGEDELYAEFEIEKETDPDILVLSDNYWVYQIDEGNKYLINDELEFTDTLTDTIESVIYYFHTRF